MKEKISALLSVSLIAFCATSSAFAQDKAPPPATPPEATPPGATPPEASSDIVVTGSRLKSSFNQPTPVAILSADQLQTTQPAGISAAIIQAPQFANTQSKSTANFTAPGDVFGTFLNLRGLGAGRTLILRDGDRVPPTSFDGKVDVETIPEMLVQRVEVVTAGVSAVYGSDAVSGVVNYILDNKFTGLKLRAQTGISTYKDANSVRLGAAYGTNFADGRGHAMFSVEHNSSDPIQHQDRPEVRQQYVFGGRGTAASPFQVRNNGVWTILTRYPYFLPGLGPLGSSPSPFGNTVTANGQLIPVDYGTSIGSTSSQIGGSGNVVNPARTLIPGSKSTRLFGTVSLDLAPNVTAFVDGSYVRNKTEYQTAINFVQALAFPGNPFTPFNNRNTAPSVYLAFPTDIDQPSAVETSEAWSVKAGLKGKIGSDWNFRAIYEHGEVRQRIINHELNMQHTYAALDTVSVGGVPTCYVNRVNANALPGCVPYNPFGATTNPATLRALNGWLFGDSIANVTNKLDLVSGSISGSPFSLPAGPVDVAVSAEYRSNSLVRTTNSDPALPRDTLGGQVRGYLANGRFNIQNLGAINGSNNVKEAALELGVPITARDSAIGALELSGAGRWTNYSTSGTVYTWKGGATWQPSSMIRFRATRSRDIRAPNLFELFAGRTTTQANFQANAPFNTANITATVVGGGNRNLKPEVANTLSLGVVLTPVPRLAISVDYYDINLKQAIQALTATDVATACAASNFTSPSCASIGLVGGGSPTPALVGTAPTISSIASGPINLAFLQTRGLDIEGSYSVPLPSATLTLRTSANVLFLYESQAGATAPVVSQAGYIDATTSSLLYNGISPKLRGTGSLNYHTNGGFDALVQARYIGSLKQGSVPGAGVTTFVYAQPKINAVWYFDLNLSKTFQKGPLGGSLQLFANVNNLFNRRPPIIPSPNNPTNAFPTYAQLYDIVGRYMTVGARMKF